jgi:hypothetical protein
MLAGDMKILFFVLTLTLAQAAPTPSPPVAREIAPNTFLLPGAILPDRGPDGNTVVLVAPSGLIAIDTGRHPWHSDGILAFARSKGGPSRRSSIRTGTSITRAGTGESKRRIRRRTPTPPEPSIGHWRRAAFSFATSKRRGRERATRTRRT